MSIETAQFTVTLTGPDTVLSTHDALQAVKRRVETAAYHGQFNVIVDVAPEDHGTAVRVTVTGRSAERFVRTTRY